MTDIPKILLAHHLNPTPVAARIVALDDRVVSIPIAVGELGIPWNWRIGPSSRSLTDPTYLAAAFTPSRTQITKITGHDTYAAKACPGFRVEGWI